MIAVSGWLSLAGTIREAVAFVLVTALVALARLERRYVTRRPTDPTA